MLFVFMLCLWLLTHSLIIIIMVIFMCYFSGEHIALSINKNNNGVNIALGKTNRLKVLCMMQINKSNQSNQTLFSNLYKYKHVIHVEIYILEKRMEKKLNNL